MSHSSFSLAAAELLVKMTSALQKSQCCSATSAAQHSGNCNANSVFACGMLQGWGLEGRGLGLSDLLGDPTSCCWCQRGPSPRNLRKNALSEKELPGVKRLEEDSNMTLDPSERGIRHFKRRKKQNIFFCVGSVERECFAPQQSASCFL